MPVGKAIDASQGSAHAPGLVNIEPADLCFPGAGFAKPFTGPLNLGQRANTALPQSWNQGYKYFGRCNSITQCAVAIVYFDPASAGNGIE